MGEAKKQTWRITITASYKNGRVVERKRNHVDKPRKANWTDINFEIDFS